MKEKHAKIFRLIYGIMLSLLIVATGIATIGCCIGVFKLGGDPPFNTKSLLISFLILLVPYILCIIAIIGGGILHAIIPPKEEVSADISTKTVLKNLYKKIVLSESPKYLSDIIWSQRIFRLVLICVIVFVFISNIVGALVTIYNDQSIFSTLNAENPIQVMAAVLAVLSYAVVPTLSVIIYNIFAAFTYEKEREAATEIIKYNKSRNIVIDKKGLPKGAKITFKVIKKVLLILTQILLVITAITFIVLGAIRGDISAIITNAIKICSGCIGLG